MFFNTGLVGIDIGTHTIKAVHLDITGKRRVLRKIVKIDNSIKDTAFPTELDKKGITKCLIKIAKSLSCKKCVVGIPSKHVIFRNVQFPKMKPQELREAVYWEAQEFAPMFDEDYVSDFELLEVQENNCRVMLAGTSENTALGYLTVLENAGFKVEAIDVYPLAVSRILKSAGIHGVAAVIDIGYSHCEIIIIEKGVVFFSRNISTDYLHFVKMSSVPVATNKECTTDISYPQDTLNENLHDVMFQSLQELMLEISKFFDLYSIQRKGHEVEVVMFIGRGSRIPCLKQVYSDYFNLPIIDAADIYHEFLEPGSIKYDNFDLIDFTNAIGFALRR
jgi:type IV pilus assembly protein PilM